MRDVATGGLLVSDDVDESDDLSEARDPKEGLERRAVFAARTKGRELALRYLYQRDLRSDAEPSFEDFALFENARGAAVEFARMLVDGVAKNRATIDENLKALAKNWALHRMAVVDRNVLRLGACEMTLPRPSPPGVAINEAVELAKKYGSAKSGRFINGILDRLARSPGFLKADAAPIDDGAAKERT
jgi:transcription antitermination protein NusB